MVNGLPFGQNQGAAIFWSAGDMAGARRPGYANASMSGRQDASACGRCAAFRAYRGRMSPWSLTVDDGSAGRIAAS